MGQQRPGPAGQQIAGRNELRRQVTTVAPSLGSRFFSSYGRAHAAGPAVTPSPAPRSRQELVTQLAVACLGAGVVTTVAVAQGQNPMTALGITLFSAVAAVMVGQVL